jgi:hypothetical protein
VSLDKLLYIYVKLSDRARCAFCVPENASTRAYTSMTGHAQSFLSMPGHAQAHESTLCIIICITEIAHETNKYAYALNAIPEVQVVVLGNTGTLVLLLVVPYFSLLVFHSQMKDNLPVRLPGTTTVEGEKGVLEYSSTSMHSMLNAYYIYVILFYGIDLDQRRFEKAIESNKPYGGLRILLYSYVRQNLD